MFNMAGLVFFYDTAEPLPYEIEHRMPDYHLYDEWTNEQLANGGKRLDYKYFLDYSIGFLTRGCFRQCEFCVNKNYKQVSRHSPLTEFYDSSRKKICLLDDNFFGCPQWKEMLLELRETGRQFHFKQGLDERLLTAEKCELLFNSKYDGDYIFAFDNIEDKKIIEEKANLIRQHYKNKGRNIKFYVLCGFDRNNEYSLDFWIHDVRDTFERIFILNRYNFSPYIMKFEKYKDSPLFGTYINLARWCNQPSMFNNHSYKQFCALNDSYSGSKGLSSTWRYYEQLIKVDEECRKYMDIVPSKVRLDYTE